MNSDGAADTWYKQIAGGTLTFTSIPKVKPGAGYVHEARFLTSGPNYARSETHQSRGPLIRKDVEKLFAEFISEILAVQPK
jgi:hypothetical protein